MIILQYIQIVNHYILYLKYTVISPLYLKKINPLVTIKMLLRSHTGISAYRRYVTTQMWVPWLSWDRGTPTSSTLCSFDIKLQKRKQVLHCSFTDFWYKLWLLGLFASFWEFQNMIMVSNQVVKETLDQSTHLV